MAPTLTEKGLHPVFLKFINPHYEDLYGVWNLPKTVSRLWFGLILAPVTSGVVLLLDSFILGRFDLFLVFIRVIGFPIVSVLIGLVLKYGKISSVSRLNFLAAIFIINTQFWQFWAVFAFPELGDQYLLIITMLSFSATITFTNLNFRFVTPAILIILTAFLLKIFLWDDLSGSQLAFQCTLATLFTSIGLTAGYLIERATRVEFVQQLEMAQKQKELINKNKELEQFAYIASHDLQEPLRSITSFSQLLNEEFRDQVGAEGGQFIDFLLEASTRMRHLIKGLLDYSRLGREVEMCRVNTQNMLAAIQMDLNTAIQESNTTITTGNLPTLNVYETEFRQLMQNLLSNAIKFRKQGVSPVIHFDAQKKGDEWEFSVKDNGIGIEKEHQEKIFLIFQRLHSRSNYEGTGIGLANCRKIVELHGGKIHVESEKDQGSIFIFTIPVK